MTEELAPAPEGATPEASGLEAPPAAAPEQPTDSAPTSTPSETATPEVPTFEVKINGQVVQVPQDELVNGYQRQSDYTSKTQELAAQRQALEHAETLWTHLQSDPKGTLEQLQEHFRDALVDPEELDPEELRLSQVEGWVSQQQQQQQERELLAEMDAIAEKFGTDFDRNELLVYAVESEIPNLEAAYVYREQMNQLATERAAADAERKAAKQGAPPISTSGSAAAGSTEGAAAPIDSLDAAIAAAKKSHGVQSLVDLL